MILPQTIDMMIPRVKTSGCRDACLTHRTGEHVLVPARLSDECGRPRQHGTDRCAEYLGEVDPDRIGHRGERTGGDASSRAGIEQASTVHMDGKAQIL
jgi:hypothetical protein